MFFPGGGGGGEATPVKEMPACVCWGSENVPILKDALDKKKKKMPILKGSSAYFIKR